MKKILFIALAVATGAFTLQSCSNKGCTDPTATNNDADAKEDDGSCSYDHAQITFHVHSYLGTTPFGMNTEVTDWNGRKVKFTLASLYISGVAFHDDGGAHSDIANSYALITPATSEYTIGTLTTGHYHSMAFNVGVDSISNHSDPASWASGHPLSSNQPAFAHWSWNTGYIFVKIEGLVDTTADKNGTANAPFAMHIGLDSYLSEVELDNHITINKSTTIGLNIDWLKLLNNIDLRTDRVTHTMDNMMLANQVKANIPSIFTIE